MSHAALQELFLQINVTSCCNLSCAHCYVDGIPRDMGLALFAEAIERFSDLQRQLSVERAWVQISGGEPLLHPDLSEILERSAAVSPTKVLTNGTLLDAAMARQLAERCESVQISFDGEEAIHDSRRGAGSFQAALTGLRLLREAGVSVSARVTVGDDNCECVEPLFRRLEPEIDAFHVSRVVPFGGCGVGMPDTRAYRRVIYRLQALRSGGAKIRPSDPFFGPLMGDSEFRGCSAGISGMCVDVNGDIYPCRRLPIRLANISEASLPDVYFTHPLLQHLRERELTGRCGECEYRPICGGSRCIAYALSGDPLATDPGCIFA